MAILDKSIQFDLTTHTSGTLRVGPAECGAIFEMIKNDSPPPNGTSISCFDRGVIRWTIRRRKQ